MNFATIRFSSPRGTSTIKAQVARTPAELQSGFANRDNIGFEEAILFDLPNPTPFTMAATRVPLDMLFLGANGRVVWIARGQPLDPNPYSPPNRIGYRYVLETSAGRLAAHQVGYDTVVSISDL